MLRKSDIEMMVSTYRERIVVDKYSYVASLSEIEENDFSLNIPRYVNTFEEEEIIDLSIVSKNLNSIEEDLKETDKSIAKICKELKIDTPF